MNKYIRKTSRPNTEPKFNNLYVKNLPKEVQTKESLIDLFKDFGEILSAVINKTADDKELFFGFVCFKIADAATKAQKDMNLKEVLFQSSHHFLV